MKLQAVTICINYSDYLECIVPNLAHFDRWVVVTVPEDEATVAVCREHNIEYVFSKVLARDGTGFHAAYHKGPIINEGLDALDQDGWVVVLDSDVYLPRNFRDRVDAMALESGTLYGMAGRKICLDREMFESIRHYEPWDRFCDRHSVIIGYFNLFNLEHSNNRYPKRTPESGGAHDDHLFYLSFEGNCAQLPMYVIHVGPHGTNWERRVAKEFSNTVPGRIASSDDSDQRESRRGNAAFVGFYPGAPVNHSLPDFERVYLVDQFQIFQPSENPILEADRTVLRHLWNREVAHLRNLQLVPRYSSVGLDLIPAESLDQLHFSGEVTPECLVAAWPYWRKKLKPGAVVSGDFFGHPYWSDSTFTLILTVGRPDRVSIRGSWLKRIENPNDSPDRLINAPPSATENRALLFICAGKADVEKLLLSFQSARSVWNGPLLALYIGDEVASLRIVAGRYGIELFEVRPEHGMRLSDLGDEFLPHNVWDHAAGLSQYERTIILPAGALFDGLSEELFDSRPERKLDNSRQPHLLVRSQDGLTEFRIPGYRGAEYRRGDCRTRASIVFCRGDVAEWSEGAWELWCHHEACMAEVLAAKIPITSNTTVATIVTPETVGDFERNFALWRFSPDTPTLIALIGLEVEDISVQPSAYISVICFPAQRGGGSMSVLEKLVAKVDTFSIFFIPPTASPLPGAELLPKQVWSDYDAILHGNTDLALEAGCDGKLLVWLPLFGVIRTDILRSGLRNSSASAYKSIKDVSLVVQSLLSHNSERNCYFDFHRLGWRFLPVRQYFPIPFEVNPAPTIRCTN